MFSKIAQALTSRRAFLLSQCRLMLTDDGFKASICSDFPIGFLPGDRKSFENPNQEKYRWAAGGGLMIIDCLDVSLALVRHRDAGAPSYGDHWTIGSGLSSSFDDMVNVDKLLVREAVEEFLVATPEGLILPVSNEEGFDNDTSFGAVGSGRHIRVQSGCTGLLSSRTYVEATASFVKLESEVNLHVGFEGEEGSATSRGLVVIDEGTRGIDLLRAIRIQVPFDSSEIEIYDGEEDRNGKPSQRRRRLSSGHWRQDSSRVPLLFSERCGGTDNNVQSENDTPVAGDV